MPERDSIGEPYCSDRKVREGRTPGKLYNSMITPVSNATIKGWLWYQVGRAQLLPPLLVSTFERAT